jgi:hypothetical protein
MDFQFGVGHREYNPSQKKSRNQFGEINPLAFLNLGSLGLIG